MQGSFTLKLEKFAQKKFVLSEIFKRLKISILG